MGIASMLIEEDGVDQRVFISYSRADRAYVERLIAHLAEAGIGSWHDDDVLAGQRFDVFIQKQVDDCGAFIVVMSPDSLSSELVNNALFHAKARGKRVFPLLLRAEVFVTRPLIDHQDVTNERMPDERFMSPLN